ncbi:sensor histidine kinase [Leifsonia sp. Le1]|uniref:sensor histidine kinase n=1 Tax=Leifsonia sp. Le1 TaxID=3404918 RepID=UPI003EBBFF88
MRVAVLSASAALALFLIPLMITVYNLSVADAQSQLQRDALAAVAGIDPQFSPSDRTEIPSPANANTSLGLYDHSGTLVAGSGPARADEPVKRALAGGAADEMVDGTLVDVVPVTTSERTVGVVRASIPLTVVIGDDITAWATILGAAALCLLVGVLIARRAARRVATPMESLANAVQALGHGDFQARATVSGIAEIDVAGAALADTAIRLRALVERQRRLSQDASHQLRTPLAGLRALLETTQTGEAGAPPDVVAQALERVDALDATIGDFLAPETRPRGQLTDIGELARQSERRWRGPLAAKGRPLRIDIPEHVEPIATDPARLQQILDVLLENAYQHGSGAVLVRLRASYGATVVDVEDEGNQIPLDADVFQRGYSGAGRSGIGLALARELTTDIGGRLLLRARLPHTQFSLILDRGSAPVPGSANAPRA